MSDVSEQPPVQPAPVQPPVSAPVVDPTQPTPAAPAPAQTGYLDTAVNEVAQDVEHDVSDAITASVHGDLKKVHEAIENLISVVEAHLEHFDTHEASQVRNLISRIKRIVTGKG